MTVDRTRCAVVIAIGVFAMAIAGHLGAKYAIASSQSREINSRLQAAIDLTAPSDAIQIYSKAERGRGLSMIDLNVYHYDFDEVQGLEEQYRGVSRAEFLRGVFARAVNGREDASDNEKWLAVMDYIEHTMRHPRVEQPMYRDGSMVTDPLILMLLHEGRCGHQARVVVDLASANNYEARLVQVAAHVVAEVKWGGAWHWIDADGGIPIGSLRSRFAELPSVEALARTPYVLDSLSFRNWEMGDSARRTLDGIMVPYDIYYGWSLTTSATYFGKQIFSGAYQSGAAPRAGIAYEYKKGTIAQWESDRYWGWNDLRTEIHEIPMVPVAYSLPQLNITGPQVVDAGQGHAVVPVRWPAQGRAVCQSDRVRNCRLVFDKVGYEVRVSRATRGWDYDYRDYEFMPKSGKGDVLVTRDVRKIDDMTFGIDLPVQDEAELFIEVVPVALDKAHSNDFMWPSNELDVQVMQPRGVAPGNTASAIAQPTRSAKR